MSQNLIVEPVKKKRGRKKKSEIEEEMKKKSENTENENVVEKPPPKKRGRKPKGGKIIENKVKTISNYEEQNSIILHLKCNVKDIIDSNDLLNNQKEDLIYYDINNNNDQLLQNSTNINNLSDSDNENKSEYNFADNFDNVNINNSNNNNNQLKNIWKKISKLKQNFHTNNVYDKNSACFWCSYDFDSPCIYIPKHKIKEKFSVYGCFCSPQCAVSFLMNENIDSSIKFERYQNLNNIYGKIYNFNENIKPAPNPYYLLDKYYGSLTIEEYRKLINNEQLLLIVDKPLTHVFPELYEDNNNFLINKKIIPNNSNYKMKTNNNEIKNNEDNIKKMFFK